MYIYIGIEESNELGELREEKSEVEIPDTHLHPVDILSTSCVRLFQHVAFGKVLDEREHGCNQRN